MGRQNVISILPVLALIPYFAFSDHRRGRVVLCCFLMQGINTGLWYRCRWLKIGRELALKIVRGYNSLIGDLIAEVGARSLLNEAMFNIQNHITLTNGQAETVLQAWLNHPVTCIDSVPVKGGMINTVLRLTFDHPPYKAVIKLNTPGVDGPYSLDKEAAILRYLRKNTHFPCPQVYAEDSTGSHIPFAYLLLECLPGDSLWQACETGLVKPADIADLDRQLARILLELHSHTRMTFGKLDEPGMPRWVDLFIPRLHEVRAQPEIGQRLSRTVLTDVDYAIARAAELLADQGVPTLVHADIWAGNIIVEHNSTGWQITGIVDPGAEYADVELELAYLESFNNARPAFMDVYTRQRLLRPGYGVRRMIYWLQTYLIHVWLFGEQHYIDITTNLAADLRRKL